MIDNLTNYVPLTLDDLRKDADFQALYKDRTGVVNDLSPKNRVKMLDLMERFTAAEYADDGVEFIRVYPASPAV